MTLEPRLYLASKSPRRRELLTQIGIRFDLLMFRGAPREDAAVDETPHPGEDPEVYARRVAKAKAEHGSSLVTVRKLVPRPVLSADTTLDVDGEIIGKPCNDEDAVDILRRLSGRSHRVITAVAVAHGGVCQCATSVSSVRFRPLDIAEIRRYVGSGEPHDKAGAYGLQGRAAIFVEEVSGSPSGVVGLPLCETALLLRSFGFLI